MITINREKAEAIVRDNLRQAREPLMAELDVQYMRALELAEDTSGITSQKQALRDVTEKDLSPLSLAELSALTLEQALAL